MSRPEADRNLLFGINALQNDFITRDALIAAMNAWVLEKHRAIGEILVERGDLSPAGRALLDQLLDHHLARHGGDAAASLAAMSSVESVAPNSAARSPTPTSSNPSPTSPPSRKPTPTRPGPPRPSTTSRPMSGSTRSATTPKGGSASSSSPATRS